ncbi:peptidase C26, partial [Enterococcus faecium]
SDCTDDSVGATDPARDIVALSLAERMIDTGKPVFGICRGLQEINVLFGGSLRTLDHGSHLRGNWADDYADLFDHVHPV